MKKKVENNVCFLYIPFSVNPNRKTQTAKQFIDSISSSDLWNREEISCEIFYGYISRRLFDQKNGLKSCHVFSVNQKHSLAKGLLMKRLSIHSPIRFGTERSRVYDFMIDKIRLIYYGDSIGFIVFQVYFLSDTINTTILANTLYFLKKTTHTDIYINKSDREAFSLYDLAVELVGHVTKKNTKRYALRWFFHIAETNARSNYLLMANIPDDTDDDECKKALYYLMNGFCDKYEYRKPDSGEEIAYFAPNGRCWGISPEASACLIRIKREKVEEKMFSEFKKSYFLLYTFLLYQKYSYYHFLSKINISRNMRTREIKKYHSDLIDFEIDSVFSVITEIPQYVGFYKKHLQAHHLAELRADVCDPINRLNETRKNKLDWMMTIWGIILSLIGLISVFIDVYQLIASFSGLQTP